MEAATIERLTDLLIDLDRAGVQELTPNGDRLRYRPRSAVTPDLAEREGTHKAELLATLRPEAAPGGPDRAPAAVGDAEPAEDPPLGPDGWSADLIDPPEPCPMCGGLVFCWNPLGDRRCVACDPPTTAIRRCEKTQYRLCQETGINEGALSRFMRGQRGMSLASIDKLYASLGLWLVTEGQPERKGTKKKGK